MKTSKFTDSQIMSILKQAESGTPVVALCREYGMSNATLYKLCAKYGGMDTSLIAILKELEAENTRLKKMYAEESLKAVIIQEAMAKKSGETISPTSDGTTGGSYHAISIRLACRAFSISEICYRYQAKLCDDNTLIAEQFIELTEENRDWGFVSVSLIYIMLNITVGITSVFTVNYH